ncbi:MAG: hypothetical protein ABIF10_01075 [Candidatus Woesearchaeota archaeon]
MARGRPVHSDVRERIIEILRLKKQAYGYEIWNFYKQKYPPVSMRLIYYHLKKGVILGEFKVQKVVSEKGDYSWGPEAEKIYYSLGPEAKK